MSNFLTHSYRNDTDPDGQQFVMICCEDSCNGFYHEFPAAKNDDGTVNEEQSEERMVTYLRNNNLHPDYPDNYITRDEDL